MWVRAPVLHIAPPLIINETELNYAMDKIDDALTVMDHWWNFNLGLDI